MEALVLEYLHGVGGFSRGGFGVRDCGAWAGGRLVIVGDGGSERVGIAGEDYALWYRALKAIK